MHHWSHYPPQVHRHNLQRLQPSRLRRDSHDLASNLMLSRPTFLISRLLISFLYPENLLTFAIVYHMISLLSLILASSITLHNPILSEQLITFYEDCSVFQLLVIGLTLWFSVVASSFQAHSLKGVHLKLRGRGWLCIQNTKNTLIEQSPYKIIKKQESQAPIPQSHKGGSKICTVASSHTYATEKVGSETRLIRHCSTPIY